MTFSHNYTTDDQFVLDHYKKVAECNGLSSTCTMEDPYVRQKEFQFIIKCIENFSLNKFSCLDLGCGNGWILSELEKIFSHANFYGIDFCKELYDLACSRKLKRTKFFHGDMRNLNLFPKNLDFIITERSLINILTLEGQTLALQNISRSLKIGGIYIMLESFIEPLKELNLARQEMCFKDILESPQNKYLTEDHILQLKEFGLQEIEGPMPINTLSSHYYITRVFHKLIRPKGSKLSYTKFSDFFKQALPEKIGDYSPLLFRLFRKTF